MFAEFINIYGMEILVTILGIIGTAFGFMTKKIYQNHINDDTKRSIARVVVQFVEQAWKSLHGPDKLQKALETAASMLAKKNIDFDAEEMKVLIEAAVAEFNEAFKKPLCAEDTSKATYRIDE